MPKIPNKAVDQTNTRTGPKRAASQPVSGTMMACPSSASACASASLASVWSILTRTSPFLTAWVSVTSTSLMVPPTAGVTWATSAAA